MKKYLIYFLFVFLFGYSSNLFAQQSSSSDAWLKYNADKKSELTAGLLEALIPIVGHAYAGNATKGIIPLVVSVGGIAAMIVGGSNSSSLTTTTSTVAIGALAYLGGRIWGIISAVNTASDYNAKLKSKLNLSFNGMQLPQGKTAFGLTLTYNF